MATIMVSGITAEEAEDLLPVIGELTSFTLNEQAHVHIIPPDLEELETQLGHAAEDYGYWAEEAGKYNVPPKKVNHNLGVASSLLEEAAWNCWKWNCGYDPEQKEA